MGGIDQYRNPTPCIPRVFGGALVRHHVQLVSCFSCGFGPCSGNQRGLVLSERTQHFAALKSLKVDVPVTLRAAGVRQVAGVISVQRSWGVVSGDCKGMVSTCQLRLPGFYLS